MLVLAPLLTERVADWIGLQRDRVETRYSIREEREIRCLLDAWKDNNCPTTMAIGFRITCGKLLSPSGSPNIGGRTC